MRPDSDSNRDLTTLIAAVALGAAAMYLLDPDKGRRRRAIARDRAASLLSHAGRFAGKGARDLAHRLDGVRARVRRPSNGSRTPDDLQLIERVRSRLGRVVSHPHAIHVGAYRSRVTVSGPVLAAEVDALLDAVRSVPGVAEVDDHLVVHETAGSVSALQGTPSRLVRAANGLPRNWTPAARVSAVVGGALLALFGLRGRSLAGVALACAGLLLGARGATQPPVSNARAQPAREAEPAIRA